MTFVLVHGAMHGGWCWRDVSDRLVAAGHRVATPTLTAQGDRRHLLTPEVGVDDHVRDLVDLMWFEDLTDVHLVLHSYAGVLAGPVVEQAADRISSVVYLAAFLTRSGECLLDVEPPETVARYRELVAAEGDGWRLPATDAFLAQWGITDPEAQAWVGPRLTDFPFRCQTDVTVFDEHVLASKRQAYVHHTDPPLPSLQASLDRATAADWEIREIATGHDMMIAAPQDTTDLLLDLADG
jgi:pimeloyl-ACP methyl ester carboxylesterase